VSRPLARAALAAVCAANVLLAVDLTAMALLLPVLARAFDAAPDVLSWMQNAYPLAIAAALPFTARIVPIARVSGPGAGFAAGALGLAAGTAVAAAAPGPVLFVVGRLLAGVGAALLLTNGLAVLRERMPPDRLPRAVGLSAAFTAIGLAAGPVLVGAALDVLDWRVVLAAVAIAAAVPAVIALPLVRRGSRERARAEAPARPGSLLVAAEVAVAVVAAAVALHAVPSAPWLAAGCAVVAVAAGALVFRAARAALTAREARGGTERLLPRVLAGDRGFRAAVAIGALAYAATIASQPFQSLLVGGEGWSSAATGLLLLPVTAGIAAGTLVSGALVDRRGVRAVVVAGFALAAGGMVLLVPLGLLPTTPPVVVLAAAGNLVSGLGVGLASPQALAYGVGLASARDAAAASSALWTSRQAAACLAYAAFALLLAPPAGTALATTVMFAVSAVLLAAAAVIAARRLPAASAVSAAGGASARG
jgi:MFS transporter, DHA2 family, methylenomycin A resistance protein